MLSNESELRGRTIISSKECKRLSFYETGTVLQRYRPKVDSGGVRMVRLWPLTTSSQADGIRFIPARSADLHRLMPYRYALEVQDVLDQSYPGEALLG